MTRIPINDDNLQFDSDDPAASEEAPATANDGPEVERLKLERDALFERLARATAEFKNAQKRLEQDKEQAVAYANGSLIKSLLPVIDSFERALAVDVAKTDPATILKGMQIVHDQWMAVLKQQTVEEIAPKPGDPFDPNKHQALMQQPGAGQAENTVTQLLQKGYELHGRTLRPAGVAVSKD